MKQSSLSVLTIAVSLIVIGQESYSRAINKWISANRGLDARVGPAIAVQSSLGPSLVSVNGRQLIVRKRNLDGTLAPAAPYIIRGVDWSPASVGTTNTLESRRHEMEVWAERDMTLIKNMNSNTVFMYLDPHLTADGLGVLDKLYNNGIMAVMTVDEGANNMSEVQPAVNFFKNHPAILAWNLGVEWNINAPLPLDQIAAKIQMSAQLIKSLDVNHPVMTNYGDIQNPSLDVTRQFVNVDCSAVDLWSVNVYRNSTFGALFDEWKAISGKPMLLGEFGTDAFLSYTQTHPPNGSEVQAMQAQWDLAEWNHLAKNLSANHPGKTAVGGFIFEWNDEWWKVAGTNGSHDVDGGDGVFCGGHPDNFCNEEYFGIVALDQTETTRLPRGVYNTMTTAFTSGYQPPQTQEHVFRASSAGFPVPNTAQGFARFYDGNNPFYDRPGVPGRGFNVAVIDSCTGELTEAPRHYDTWATRTTGEDMTALTSFLNGLPNGVVVMLAVADEAGLTFNDDCPHLPFSWIEPFYQAVEALGSTQIRSYCYRNSWAMVAIKGTAQSAREQLLAGFEVSAQITVAISSKLSPASRSFSASPGRGTIMVNMPGGCNWTAVSLNSFITIDSGASGSGSGVVTYSVAANTGPVRSGIMTIAGNLFPVTQAAPGGSAGRTPFEFDSDAKTDNSVWRPSSGLWLIKNSSNGGTSSVGWGLSSDQIVPGDYDGDGKTDIAVWRPSTGVWFIINSSSGAVTSTGWGVNTDIPVPGDYDGDGKTDLAVWRPSTGTWFIINSSTGSASTIAWGTNGDVPTAGDYDGDGKSDVAVWRPSSGTWFIIKSSNGQAQVVGWGVSGDKVVPADYDGDSKTDVAVWRPSTGVWFIIRSSDGTAATLGWGVNSDVATPGDYDGDGKIDLAVWRPSSGTWFIIRSSDGSTSAVVWGINGDVAVPSAFVRP